MRGARPQAALEADFAATVSARAGEVLVAAVSGGADSAALSALLAQTAERAGATAVFAHVNHGVRRGAWQDEAVVLALGAALGVRVVTAALDAGSADEARLRGERYAKLTQIATAVGAARVFTAHHAEDQTETVLLALFRGAGPDGLCGMPLRRQLAPGLELVRPLLEVLPQALRSYCHARHLPFAIDPTNVELAYRRNAVRAALAPLRADFPHLDAAVARCATILREERAGDPAALVRRQLREELTAIDGDARELTFERLDAAARAVLRGARGRHFLRRGIELVVGD